MNTALATPRDYEGLLEQKQERLTALLAGTGIEPGAFIGMTVQAIARDPGLLAPDVDQNSVLLAILSVAEMGIIPNGKDAYLVAYRDKSGKKIVKHIVGWQGLIKMALRSGQLRAAWAHPVYEGDQFGYVLGDRPHIDHSPTLDPSTRGNITHFYAVLHLANGERVFEVMTTDEVDAIRKRSRAKESGPWVTDYVEMGRKTPIRRVFKYHPQVVTPQLAAALQAEDDWEDDAPTALALPSGRRQRLLAHYGAAEPDSTVTETPDGNPPSAAEPDGLPDLVGTAEEPNGGDAK